MKGVKSQGVTCHVPFSSDSEIHIEEAPEDAYGSGHHGPEPAANPETLLL